MIVDPKGALTNAVQKVFRVGREPWANNPPPRDRGIWVDIAVLAPLQAPESSFSATSSNHVGHGLRLSQRDQPLDMIERISLQARPTAAVVSATSPSRDCHRDATSLLRKEWDHPLREISLGSQAELAGYVRRSGV